MISYTVFYLYLTILFISFLFSLLIYFRNNVPLYLRLFPPFLLLTLVVEITGHILTLNNIINTSFYNFFFVVEFVFYYFVVYQFVQNAKFKKVIFYSMYTYSVIALINIFFIQGIKHLHTYTINLGALLLISFCVYYLYELIKRPVIKMPLREPAFWITCGLITFYSVTQPLIAAYNFAFEYNLININILAVIQITPNYILYPSFAIAFYCYFKYGSKALMTPNQPLPTTNLTK